MTRLRRIVSLAGRGRVARLRGSGLVGHGRISRTAGLTRLRLRRFARLGFTRLTGLTRPRLLLSGLFARLLLLTSRLGSINRLTRLGRTAGLAGLRRASRLLACLGRLARRLTWLGGVAGLLSARLGGVAGLLTARLGGVAGLLTGLHVGILTGAVRAGGLVLRTGGIAGLAVLSSLSGRITRSGILLAGLRPITGLVTRLCRFAGLACLTLLRFGRFTGRLITGLARFPGTLSRIAGLAGFRSITGGLASCITGLTGLGRISRLLIGLDRISGLLGRHGRIATRLSPLTRFGLGRIARLGRVSWLGSFAGLLSARLGSFAGLLSARLGSFAGLLTDRLGGVAGLLTGLHVGILTGAVRAGGLVLRTGGIAGLAVLSGLSGRIACGLVGARLLGRGSGRIRT